MQFSPPLRTVVDFPREGIRFIDITPWLGDASAFDRGLEVLRTFAAPLQVDVVAAPEARGFIVGAPLASKLGAGFVPVRKPGHLPAATIRSEYQLEYGRATLELHRDAVRPGQRVLVVDDLLATGGTVAAAIELISRLGGEVVGVGFFVELSFLGGRGRLGSRPIRSVVSVDS